LKSEGKANQIYSNAGLEHIGITNDG